MSKDTKAQAAAAQMMVDDEPDDWDKRIFSTGCAGAIDKAECGTELTPADENAKLTDCYYEKKDWRACKAEVSRR
ncbi:hypothetical protein E8E11_008296 [Didymella keratinophila]|nr:hypothetical protein E8E11_008296 [Didymella keratinophila]